MVDPKFMKFDTLSLHGGQQPDPTTGARAVPIYQTVAYNFRDADHAASLFNLERAGNIYSRISNPTVSVLEERISALEGGVGAVATASGHAALHLAIVTLMDAGSHIVASKSLYGGSVNLLKLTLPRFGITTTFVDARDPQAFADAIRPETRMVFGETIGNPGLEILDVPKVAKIANDHGLPLVIDSTFTTPYLCRSISLGADLVVISATKWLGGHGIAMGGLLVDSGRFDWEASGKFPTMTDPYKGYHSLDYVDSFGPQAFVMRARTEGLRDFGACMSPQNAFYLIQGLETLPLRMERHMKNTEAVLQALQANENVAWVIHPSLESHPDHELAKKLLPKGAGSIVSFGVKGGYEAGKRFIQGCKLASHLANVGDAKTLVIHPASTTHLQVGAKQLKECGVGDDMIRLSVGLEDPVDIINDLGDALRASQRA
jgi:O-acetylhomoserine (thiol)-lyase